MILYHGQPGLKHYTGFVESNLHLYPVEQSYRPVGMLLHRWLPQGYYFNGWLNHLGPFLEFVNQNKICFPLRCCILIHHC
jgi:hypothetical protein